MYFQRLRDLREDMDMNQTQVAQLLFTSQTVYSRYELLSHYEKGIRECGQSFLVRIADFYDVSTDYILGRTNNKRINK